MTSTLPPVRTTNPTEGFAPFRRFLWRDLIILALTGILWGLHLQTPLTGAAGYACGLLTGVCALQSHEWAHVWGAFRARADIYPPRQWWQPFIFSLDHHNNSREQFMAVSLPAFAATAIYISLFWWLLPGTGVPGYSALIMGSVTAALTLLIEVPLFIHVYRGASVPPVEMFKRPLNPTSNRHNNILKDTTSAH